MKDFYFFSVCSPGYYVGLNRKGLLEINLFELEFHPVFANGIHTTKKKKSRIIC